MTLSEWLKRIAGTTTHPYRVPDGEDKAELIAAYNLENAKRTLRVGRVASIVAMIAMPYFIFQDIYVLKLDILPWRILGSAPFPIFAILAFTALPKRVKLTIPIYAACMFAFVGMMAGIVAQVLTDGASSEYSRYLVIDSLVVVMVATYIFSGGLKRLLAPMLFGPFAAMALYVIVASPLSSQQLSILSNPAGIALILSLMGEYQERLSFNEFAMRRLAGKRGTIIAAQNNELAVLNAELETALVRLEADLEDKRLAEERIRQDRSILQAFLDSIADPAYVVDTELAVAFANQAFAQGLGLALESIIGRRLPDLLPEVFDRYQKQTLETVSRTREFARIEIETGGRVIEDNVYPVLDPDGRVAYFGILGKDITERKRSETALADLASRDALTGLQNRRSMGEALEKAVARASRGQRSALLYLDLDNFKIVNDRRGHEAGDEVLRSVASLLVKSIRAEDSVFRLGGDEFAVILDGTQLGDVRPLIDRLRASLKGKAFVFDGEAFEIGLSVGAAEIDGHSESAAILSIADAAMYADKKARKSALGA